MLTFRSLDAGKQKDAPFIFVLFLADDYVGDAFEGDDQAGYRDLDLLMAAFIDLGVPLRIALSQLNASGF